MATKTDLDAELTKVQTEVAGFIASVTSLITEMTNAFARLLAKIAAGSPDLQPSIDQIKALEQTLTDAQAQVDSAIAQAQVEGN